MRPLGQINQALRAAWHRAAQTDGRPVPAYTSRDVVQWLVPQGVGQGAARNTVKNLARAGQLRPVGTVRAPGSCKPLVLYLPAWAEAGEPQAGQRAAPDPAAELAAVTRSWRG